jgi:uncharacterized protein involved in response to NO
MTSIPRPPFGKARSILSDGPGRPVLSGAVWAGLASLILLPAVFGSLQFQTAFRPFDLQVHETLFGYLGAIFAGFVLTAIPEWTGRPPLRGRTLGVLVLLWLAGRVAMVASGLIGPLAAGGIDSLFLLLVAATAVREAASGPGWKAVPPIGLLIVFLAANVIFHIGAYHSGSPETGKRIGIAAAVVLVTLVGGRVFPSLDTAETGFAEPAPFKAVDLAALVVSALALAVWIALPEFVGTAVLLLIAGIVHAVRLSRWVRDGQVQNTLTLIQQIAYGFVPLGFVVTGFTILSSHSQPLSADIAVWTVSATGILTLATAARVSFDDSGLPGAARPVAFIIYAAVAIAAVARLLGWPTLSGAALAAGFAVFTIGYMPLLARPVTFAR